jgi:hypothetical protein
MTNTTDPIQRAKAHAEQMFPEAEVSTRSVRGRPVVLATEGNLIRLVRLTDLDASSKKKAAKKGLDSRGRSTT